MLDEFRSTRITWDKATSRIYSPVTANASDENGRKLVVQIVNGGQVEDLTGVTLHLYWETRDKAHNGLDVFDVVDLKKGEFALSYTTGMLSNKGVLNANLVLIDTVGRVVSERFKITVTEGIDNDAIQSEDSFSSLTQALIDISNLETDIKDFNDRVDQIITTPVDGNITQQEIIDARQSKASLGANLTSIKSDLLKFEENGEKYVDFNESALIYGASKFVNLKWEIGSFVSGSPNPSDNRIRTSNFLIPKEDVTLKILDIDGAYKYIIVKYLLDGTFVSGTTFETNKDAVIPFSSVHKYKLVLAKENNEVINDVNQATKNIAVYTGKPVFLNKYDKISDLYQFDYSINDFSYKKLLTTGTSTGATRIVSSFIEYDSTLSEVLVDCTVAGVLKIKLFTENTNGMLDFVREFHLTAEVGLNSFSISEELKRGQYIGFYSDDARVKLITETMKYKYFAGDATGNDTAFIEQDSTYNFAISFNVSNAEIPSPGDLTKKIEVLSNNGVESFEGLKSLNKYSLLRTDFSTMPDGWVNNGFTLNGGLKSPAVGGADVIAYWDIDSTLDVHIIRARVKINDVNSKFAIGKKWNTHGQVAIVDCASKKISLSKSWNGGTTLPAEHTSAELDISIVQGREYIVTNEKSGSIHTLTITDTTNGRQSVVQFDNSTVETTDYVGKAWGSPFVMFLNGDITVRKYEYISNAPKDSRVLIFGDSITEGFGLDNNTANYEDRWSAKVRKSLNGNAMISGRGGGTSEHVLSRLNTDLDKFEPKYVVVLIGTNDTDIAVWKTNIGTIINRIESKGAIPILCAPPAQSSKVIEMAEHLRKLPYTVVGFDYATTINNDGVTKDTSLYVDATHPNKSGHAKMFNQFLIDAPEVIE